MKQLADTHKGKKLRIFFQDEARIGQKGRVCRRWFTRGQRPPGLVDQRYTFAYIYGAVEPGTDTAFALVLAETNTKTMQVLLDEFAKTIAPDEYVALFLDSAGWHRSNDLVVPACITLMPLPPYSPELNPVERAWEYLKERFLSHRLLDDFDAVVDWNKMTAEQGRLTSLTWLPWEPKAKPSGDFFHLMAVVILLTSNTDSEGPQCRDRGSRSPPPTRLRACGPRRARAAAARLRAR